MNLYEMSLFKIIKNSVILKTETINWGPYYWPGYIDIYIFVNCLGHSQPACLMENIWFDGFNIMLLKSYELFAP